jgi:hypothetical protein
VTPGDHREKLGDATIRRLNEALAKEMAMFGYEPE